MVGHGVRTKHEIAGQGHIIDVLESHDHQDSCGNAGEGPPLSARQSVQHKCRSHEEGRFLRQVGCSDTQPGNEAGRSRSFRAPIQVCQNRR